MDRKSDCALLLSARRARASAARFAAIVDRFGAEMPGHIDRLHEALADIRHVAGTLEQRTPAQLAMAGRQDYRLAAE